MPARFSYENDAMMGGPGPADLVTAMASHLSPGLAQLAPQPTFFIDILAV